MQKESDRSHIIVTVIHYIIATYYSNFYPSESYSIIQAVILYYLKKKLSLCSIIRSTYAFLKKYIRNFTRKQQAVSIERNNFYLVR